MRLLKKDQGRLVTTKVDVLICGKERALQFPDAWVQCGRFIGRDKARIFDHIDLHDHLPQAVDSILLPGMTIVEMRRGVSKIRNHVIARIFREMNLIEQWGSGIPRILSEAEALGLPDL